MANVKAYAWYFPNWHPTPMNDHWHGKGWTEWECVKCARPRFEGHLQPKVPLWGYEDESDPKVFEKKIETAHKYGIDGFIFDFYWYKEGPYRKDCLEKGFLGASNNNLCEFSIMWCNHNPIYVHPAAYRMDNLQLLDGSVDKELFFTVTQYCIDNYFAKPNYQRIDGKIAFSFWHLADLIKGLGGIEKTLIALNDFRKRAKEAGFELHIMAERLRVPGYEENDATLFQSTVETLKIDSIFTYDWPKPESNNWPTMEYTDVREYYFNELPEKTELVKLPFSTTVSTGWDSSPRTVQSDMYENVGYPFSHILVGNTPNEVEQSFRKAKEFIESDKHTGKFFTISTWNEWTEGNYLEPDTLYGYGYLEAFKKVFRED